MGMLKNEGVTKAFTFYDFMKAGWEFSTREIYNLKGVRSTYIEYADFVSKVDDQIVGRMEVDDVMYKLDSVYKDGESVSVRDFEQLLHRIGMDMNSQYEVLAEAYVPCMDGVMRNTKRIVGWERGDKEWVESGHCSQEKYEEYVSQQIRERVVTTEVQRFLKLVEGSSGEDLDRWGELLEVPRGLVADVFEPRPDDTYFIKEFEDGTCAWVEKEAAYKQRLINHVEEHKKRITA